MIVTQLERKYKIALLSVKGIGPRTWRKVQDGLTRAGLNLEEAWQKDLLRYGVEWGMTNVQLGAIKEWQRKHQPESWQEELEEKEIEVVLSEDEVYPVLLRELSEGDRPEILFVRGELKNLSWREKVAVVGTRRATWYGKEATKTIVEGIVEEGGLVVSGFMYGIDVAAQSAAHQAGGRTIGVLGYGFDYCFPRPQEKLMVEMIAAGQTFVTEYSPDTPPLAAYFPQRNRIVAGMSWGTVVIEAAEKSGSLITADLAVDYGRDVFAVPGPITSPYSRGIKNLLKIGAIPITSGAEVLQELRGETESAGLFFEKNNSQNKEKPEEKSKKSPILTYLFSRDGQATLEDIQQGLKQEIRSLQAEMTMLILAGKIEQIGEVIKLIRG